MDKDRSESMDSAREAREESASSVYEKGDRYSGEANEKNATGVDGAAETSSTKEQEIETSGRGRSQSRRSQDGRSLKTIRSHHSRAGGDGYTCLDPEANAQGPNRAKDGAVTEQPYLVTWDGDADPENPKSMSKLRRWGIVLICAASSLCV